MTDKPEAPPGYIFFSNYGSFNYETKENRTEESITKELTAKYNIPTEDIIVLQNCVPHSKYSVFLLEKYSEWIKAFIENIERMLKYFKEIDERKNQ